MNQKISQQFYLKPDVVALSKELLGKLLMTQINGVVCGGRIVETEAYKGPEDKASHAFNGKRTPRTEVMFSKGGVAYIYKCYGMYDLFNVVTNKADIPHAILVRAVEPLYGVEEMLKRRKLKKIARNLTGGPGLVCQALGITSQMSGESLLGATIWLEEGKEKLPGIIEGPRVGIAYAEDHAALPWRFRIQDNPFTSPAK